MKISQLKISVILCLILIYLTACNAPTDPGMDSGSRNNVTSIEDIDIPADFNWKTQKDIVVKLRGYQTSLVRLLSEDGTIYHQANLINNSEYSFVLTVPSYMEKITIVYNGDEKEFDLNRTEIDHTFRP